MTVADNQPLIFWENGQGNIGDVCFFFPYETFKTLTYLTFFFSAYEESWQGLPRPEGKPSQPDRCRSPWGRQWDLFGCEEVSNLFTFGLYFFSLIFILSFSFGDVQVGTIAFFLLFYSNGVHRWASLLNAWSRTNVIGRKFSIGRMSC